LLKKLMPYIGKYKKYVILVPVFVLLDVLCELSMPLLMARIVDVGIPAGDVAYIIRTGLLMILLAVGAILFGVINMFFSTQGSMGFGANLRDALFEKISKFSFANIDQFSTSSLVTRVTNDVNNLQVTFMMVLRMMLRAPMMLIIAFVFAYQINSELSVVLGAAIIALVIGVWLIIRTAVKRFTVVQEKVDAINRTIQENLIGIRVVKSFVRSDYEIGKFSKANDEFTHSAIRAVNLAILSMPVMMLILNLTKLVVIWMGGHMVYLGTMGAGELISYISYLFMILMSVMMISMMVIMGSRAQASGERIVEVMDARIDIVDKTELLAEPGGNKDLLPASIGRSSSVQDPQVTSGKVEFRNVSFKYNLTGTGENVLSNISFAINPGEIVAIVGGTATGKSTLVNLMPRLYDVTQGAILVDDVDVRDYHLETLRNGIAVVLQKNTLFSGTIRENLLWGNENATQEDIEAACKDAQAHEFIMSFPQGYDTDLGQGGVNVSGGQKQRLCIARAMLKKPKILILDDSTSAVDMATEAKIRKAFYHNLADTTIFIIAQRISSVSDADKIIVLDDGKISGVGTHAELLVSNEIYQEINSSQQEGVMTE
jgi:ATP-binding cassette subfamily B multidrug efflux pump